MSGPVNGQVSWTYNNDFNVTQISIPGAVVGLTYDNDGLVTIAGDMSLTRDASNGLLTGTALGDFAGAYAYSMYGEVTGYSINKGAANLYGAQYTHDLAGRIVTKTVSVGS